MKQSRFTILKNEPLTSTVYRMVLEGDTSAITKTGQFLNIKIDGLFLRRPISVCDYDDKTVTILYKVVGAGTEAMKLMAPPSQLDILTGLGNGYDTTKSGSCPLLIGGGVGVPPMYRLAKNLLAEGKTPIVILGFNTKDEAFYIEEFEHLGAKVLVATSDGSLGTKGFVTDIVSNLSDYTYFYACGPEPMLKALSDCTKTSGQLSFEERMGCGFGACMGCSCETKYGSKRICKDGPVLEKEEIIW
ncbi:dihydroorotate dehydrogenase B (NAD(+)), electron transfer subunit [Anaerotignum neopropionicum]|uniref:Dihydroorotate dehydrogenase B (NAD(+)), electron transfer subunit n=1 Tax=Anaerotignum neopropionicum TaxID=36847 RepID=A0A136WCZ2_9FIRM|nr:dihydroorotate dehydrogenase electron transfer subunit [Anaerotignum neopropionicum]KXL52346.1 dihydroorotate dehydrogenase B (NAD(+)), electron transfer subunit [Anaerotignum neopropionicum]